MSALREPFAAFAAVFADEIADERDRREFCGHCGTLKTAPECCEESHFMTGQQFHQAHGYWPGDY